MIDEPYAGDSQFPEPRTAWHADESFWENGSFLVAEISEGKPGYDVAARRSDLAAAVAEGHRLNTEAGLSADDVDRIRQSSLAAAFGDTDD